LLFIFCHEGRLAILRTIKQRTISHILFEKTPREAKGLDLSKKRIGLIKRVGVLNFISSCDVPNDIGSAAKSCIVKATPRIIFFIFPLSLDFLKYNYRL